MDKTRADKRPENVKKRFPNSIVPLVNGQALIKAARKHTAMIMATNIRCKLPVEGIVLASMAARAPVMYEIAKSELGYTEFTPQSFAEFIVEENERLGNTDCALCHSWGPHHGEKARRGGIGGKADGPGNGSRIYFLCHRRLPHGKRKKPRGHLGTCKTD